MLAHSQVLTEEKLIRIKFIHFHTWSVSGSTSSSFSKCMKHNSKNYYPNEFCWRLQNSAKFHFFSSSLKVHPGRFPAHCSASCTDRWRCWSSVQSHISPFWVESVRIACPSRFVDRHRTVWSNPFPWKLSFRHAQRQSAQVWSLRDRESILLRQQQQQQGMFEINM